MFAVDMSVQSPRFGLLWRAEWDPVGDPAASKLHAMFDAFAELGVHAEPVVYSDDAIDAVREQLLGLDGVLVWVNPIQDGLDRSRLDPLLREVADAGVFVSAHPDVILRLGTKQVLVDTREMSWGTQTYAYRSPDELRERLSSLEGPIVLKQHRGMGGDGVWKAELVEPGVVEVQEAAIGDRPKRVAIDEFVAGCPFPMIEQPFLPRLAEGMTRVYVCHDAVVGFALQFPRGLLPPADGAPPPKTFTEPSAPEFAELRERMEREWLPDLQRVLGLEPHELPVIWDADLVHGDDGGYVLLEINCSSTFAFPEFAMPAVARAAVRRSRDLRASSTPRDPAGGPSAGS
jgi:Domain of unknown function (DUF6815)